MLSKCSKIAFAVDTICGAAFVALAGWLFYASNTAAAGAIRDYGHNVSIPSKKTRCPRWLARSQVVPIYEELGILIEVKFVRGPDDQKRLFEEYSQDLVLYAQWPHLRTLIYLIYNAADLRDAEAFEKLSSTQEIGGKRFAVKVVLA